MQKNNRALPRMNTDTYKYTTSQSIDEQLSNLIEIQQQFSRHDREWMNKKLRLLKLLQKSSVLVKETGSDIRLYHYEMPSRELTHLTLIDPDFVAGLNQRTEYLILHNIFDTPCADLN